MKLIITNYIRHIYLILVFVLFTSLSANSQRFLSDFDTSYFVKDTVLPILKRFENLRFTGYIQPQLQLASSPGAASYNGGNFSTYSKSRFMLRRARLKMDYLMAKNDRLPQALFSFQIDATERGVFVRDMFLKLFETKKDQLNLTMGLFARPFGYEVNLSSAFRETPERGRMSQILFPSERDLGVMISYEPQRIKSFLHFVKLDAGFFNGQGLSGATDFDSRKDFISRVYIKPFGLGKFQLSGGVSLLAGGWKNATKYIYEIQHNGGSLPYYSVDSSVNNLQKIAPRNYKGADLQLKLDHAWGETEFRAEYWTGVQPGTSVTSTNPGELPLVDGLPAPTYMRHFDGAFLLFLQNLINAKHQVMVKYDWYDPNVKVSANQIGRAGSLTNIADIRFDTWGLGYSFQMNPATRLIIYYDIVSNEKTGLEGFQKDLHDNILTIRLHFRF